ncbi:hypothetical protein D9M68_942510 [compost metagenome]
MLPVGQAALVQRFQGAALDLPGHEVVGREHHIVAGAAGHQLGIERLVAVIDVIVGGDAAGRLEVLQGVRRDVIGPVVDAHVLGGLAGRCDEQQWNELFQHVDTSTFVVSVVEAAVQKIST